MTVLFTQQSCKQTYLLSDRHTSHGKVTTFSDSLSVLQALEKFKMDHPLLIQIQDMLHTIEADQLTNDVHQCLIQLLIKNINYMQT